MREIITRNAEETEHEGFLLAKSIKEGDSICLYGDLGFGKTTFVKGLAKGLGIAHRIISPTFILIRKYKIRSKKQKLKSKSFYHIDLYRLENEKELENLGLGDILKDKEAITVIEWPEKIAQVLPKKRKEITIEYIDENKRKIIFRKS